MMNVRNLDHFNQLDTLYKESFEHPVIIFKHSTRCSISDIAHHRIMHPGAFTNASFIFYYLDLIRHREISNEIAYRFKVHHESPQVLILHDGECVYDCSHLDIQVDEILDQLTQLAPAE
jgi:bacillithiol system protein YtxJ